MQRNTKISFTSLDTGKLLMRFLFVSTLLQRAIAVTQVQPNAEALFPAHRAV